MAGRVNFLTKSLSKNAGNQSLKGGSPEAPDIKIIMNVCTPLNKVSGFHGSKILVVEFFFLNSFPT